MAEKKNYWAATIAFLLLFVLPAGSYLYLKKGFKYRSTSLEEMVLIDSLDWGRYTIRHGLAQDDSLQNKLVIAARLHTSDKLNRKKELLEKLHKQFGTRQEVKFVWVYDDDYDKIHFTDREILDDIFMISNYRGTQIKKDELTLIDQQGHVRGYYGLDDQSQMQKLVRHIAVLLPLEKRKRLDLIRKSD